MNAQLRSVPDYQAAIYETLLRIETILLADHPGEDSIQQYTPTTQNAAPSRATMSINEAARYLGVGRSTLYELVRTRQLRSVRVGRRILIPTQTLDAYINDG